MSLVVLAPLVSIVAAATPSPEFDPNTVTPGPAGFVAIAVVAVGTVLLSIDMARRVRRNTYRAEIQERLQAEIAAKSAADADPAGADKA
ncbi:MULTISPECIES: hypothetical protein [Cryobacterium]|uniref:Uncharacterized protein n=1 Tax=Cryobacterium breve TaxID=1259258 RepID=A0ABY2J2Z9_9MICO|nr:MULTISPECIES: hypothetical protein [Cryobacterium]TFC90987.1 hypothetical protein E3T20_15305 [Cryobacterium sp. TmT3-12]TFC99306.1 hypothetical protein E3O65_06440 [Cryobacterium breve]